MGILMEYTGGNFAFIIGAAIFASISLVVSMISLFYSMNKNQAINKTKKIELFITIISIIIVAFMIGGIIGYYLCMYQMLK